MSQIRRADTRLSILIGQQIDSKLWYERLNLVHKCKRFCQKCAGSFTFWLTVAILTLVEPVLCSYMPQGNILLAQLAVLAASSVLYVIQLIGVATREWEKIVMIQALSSSVTIVKAHRFTPVKLLVFFTAEGEYILEFGCLLGGWLAIFISPGLAILRCFRVFRLLWFCDLAVFRGPVEDFFNPLLGADFVARGFKVMKFAIKALSALGNEMFRLTSATRGGLLLMLMFFYSAFILGTATWIETGGQFENCTTRAQCVYILMRLTFYDGDGFNFIFGLTDRHRFLFFITILYLCITGFGIMNGLVGIFGTAFSGASDEAFADQQPQDGDESSGTNNSSEQNNEHGGRKQAHAHKLATMAFRSFRGDPDSSSGDEGETEGRDGDAAGDQAPGLKPSEMAEMSYSAKKPNLESWSSDEEASLALRKPPAGGPAGAEVWPFEAQEEGVTATNAPSLSRQQSKKIARQDALQEQIDTLTPSDKLEMRRQLAGKLGAKSQFALAELKRIAAADAASPPAPALRKGNSAKGAAVTSKPVELTRAGTGTRVVPVQKNTALSGEADFASSRQQGAHGAGKYAVVAEGEQGRDETQAHPHHHNHHNGGGAGPHAGGMFKRQASNKNISSGEAHANHLNYVKTNPFAASIQSKHANVTGHAQQALEIRSLTLNVQALTRKMEAQSELIAAMYRHMQMMAHGGKVQGLSAPGGPDVGSHTEHGFVHALHAAQHAVQDSLGSVLHPHHLHQSHAQTADVIPLDRADDPAGSVTAAVGKVRTLPPLDTSLNRPGALSPGRPSQTPQTAAPSAAPTPSTAQAALGNSGAAPSPPEDGSLS